MTSRSLLLALSAAFILFIALSTGGSLFWLFFWLIMMTLVYGFVSALWTASTLRVHCELTNNRIERGGEVCLSMFIRHACPFPVADLLLLVTIAGNEHDTHLRVAAKPFKTNKYAQYLYCAHVGEYPSGIHTAKVSDVFSIFSFTRRVDTGEEALVVQPRVYLTSSLAFSPGDSEQESITRAFQDATLPTDLRAYQQGDELKKIHWKLSMRKKELLVRVYEQPLKPDALLLVDCAPPETSLGSAADVRDAICEAAASVASVALSDGAPVRMPLLAEEPIDINAQKPEDMNAVLDALGRCAFDGAEEFERVLLLETRRMRRTGSTAIVTSRMNPVITDMILRIRRMGPKVRVFLVADGEDEHIGALITRLQRNDVQVDIVKLAPHP